MTFSSLIGNDSAKDFLQALSRQRGGPQVLLFYGPDGVGKKSFALQFAKMLFGEKHGKKIDQKNHPDVLYFKPEGKTHQHPIASIRSILEEAGLPPFEAPLKIYFIEEAERMLASSSNALLKVLEEPTACCRFFLFTSRPDEILPTIASRCCKVPFYPIQEELLAQYLTSHKEVPFAKAKQIALKSQGSFAKAIELLGSLEDPIHLCFMDFLKNFFLTAPSLPFVEALGRLEKLLEKKGEQDDPEAFYQIMDKLFEDLLFWLRDLHLLQETSSQDSIFHSAYLQEMQNQLKIRKIPSLEKAMLLIEEARLALQRSFKPKTVLEQLFLNLAR